MPVQLIRLTSDQSPWPLELQLQSITRFDSGDKIRVILPSSPIGKFHRDLLAFAILASAAHRHSIEVRVDAIRWTPDALTTICHTPIGLLSLLRAEEITNASGEPLPEAARDRIHSIAVTQKGILESAPLRGRSFTYAAIDPPDDRSNGYPIPRILDGELTKEAFAKDIRNVVRNLFGLQSGTQRDVADPHVSNLVQCIYEIFRNTFDHARRTATNQPIGGVRYLQVRKRIANSPSDLVPIADGFEELTSYLRLLAKSSESKTTTLLEINIGDCGEGTHAQICFGLLCILATPDT